MQVVPTILTDDVEQANEWLKMLVDAKDVVRWVQLDVIDGVFAEAVTLVPESISQLEGFDVFEWEVHLMVEEPIEWLERCAAAGMKRVIGHVEMMRDQEAFVNLGMRLGMEVGLAIDLATEVRMISEDVWVWLDRVLVMSVKAGSSGQRFEEQVLKKVEALQRLRETRGYGFLIEVDGGVNGDRIEEVVTSGGDVVAALSAVYRNGKVRENIESLGSGF